MKLEKCWRWFGNADTTGLKDLKQMGVEGVVTALSEFKPGEVWTLESIKARRDLIEQHGMRWSVVESLPVSEEIKKGSSQAAKHIKNYIQSLHNLAECGIDRVCYNFMPVIDWVRTDLTYIDEDGTETMMFDPVTFAMFDIFILRRDNAKDDYSPEILKQAEALLENDGMTEEEKKKLSYNLIVITQGFINSGAATGDNYLKDFKRALTSYRTLGEENFRNNFSHFLKEIIPVAQKLNIKMAVHPDDPPFPILGLPRIASTLQDFEWIFEQEPSPANGMTFCTGSLGVRADNDLSLFLDKLGDRIHFAHLRNLKHLEGGRFFESGHIDGDIDMVMVVTKLLKEQIRRKAVGDDKWRIPMRPDHGKKMLDDFGRSSNPGYPMIGRFRGISEIRGMEKAINAYLKT